jgi:hypothetical protein
VLVAFEKMGLSGDGKLLEDLTTFMVHNRSLRYLNLSHCQISAPFLRGMVSKLPRAQSLLVLEVTGNQGSVDPGVRGQIMETLGHHVSSEPFLTLGLEQYRRVAQLARQIGRKLLGQATR